jgi:hypothetical protein
MYFVLRLDFVRLVFLDETRCIVFGHKMKNNSWIISFSSFYNFLKLNFEL